MKKVFAFFGAALFVAAMTVACGHKTAEAVDSTIDSTIEEAAACTETAVESAADVDADAAMLAAAKEAGQAICECTKGDAASIESCMKSVLSASYAAYEGNDAFAAAVKAEIEGCVKAKATAAAKNAAEEGLKAGANAIADKLNKKK